MLAEKIIELRTQHHMSQGDLAEKLNVSRQSVSKWETGASTPDLDKLILLSELFSISLDELVKGTKSIPFENIQSSNDTHTTKLNDNHIQRNVGYILIVASILVFLFGLQTPISNLFALYISLYILACGLICVFSKKHVGRKLLITTLIFLGLFIYICLVNTSVTI